MADNFENELNRSEKLLKERLIRAGKIARDINDKAFKELLSTINEYSNAIDDISEKLVEQLVSYDKIKLSTRQFGDALKSTLPFIKENKDLTSKLTQLYTTNNKLATSLVRNQEDLIVGQLSTQDIAKDIAKVKQQQLNIELAQRDISQEIEILNREAVGLQDEELENIVFKLEALKEINEQLDAEKENTQSIANNLSKQAKSAAEIETKVGIGGKLLEGFKKIPILGDILDVGGAKEAMQAAAANGASGFSTIGTGIKALGPSLKAALGPLGLILVAVEAVKALVDAMFEADKRVTDLSRNLQISKEEARGIDGYFKSIKGSLETQYNLTKNIYQAQAELSELSAASVLFSKETLDAQIQLTKEYGLQAQDAANLNKIFTTNDELATDALGTAAKTTSQFFKQTKVLMSERKLLEQASKVSGQLLVSFKGSTKELINAVAKANLLGITLEKAKNISMSMLNFEESISSELEAELLTGKNLNFERARSLSLQGKFVEAAEEAVKQVGTLERFQNMNVIAQQAIAKAAGLTVDELSDALVQQKLINKDAQAQYARLKEARQDDLARRYALGEYDDKEIAAANKRLDAQEKFNLALEKVKEVFTDLVDGGTLDKLSNIAMAFADTLASGGSVFSLFGKSDLDKNIEKKEYESAQKTVKDLTDKRKEGELSDAEIKKLVEAQNLISKPKVNRMGMRLTNEEYEASDKADDFIIRPGQKPLKFRKDDIVIGGTNLGGGGNGEVVSLLKELISAVTSGGDVYLDGTKVGTAMAVSSFKVQ
jgi:hypothetical protein